MLLKSILTLLRRRPLGILNHFSVSGRVHFVLSGIKEKAIVYNPSDSLEKKNFNDSYLNQSFIKCELGNLNICIAKKFLRQCPGH